MKFLSFDCLRVALGSRLLCKFFGSLASTVKCLKMGSTASNKILSLKTCERHTERKREEVNQKGLLVIIPSLE